jgi:hypothetical protein
MPESYRDLVRKVEEIPLLFVGDVVRYGKEPRPFKITRVKIAKAFATESVTGRKVELRIEHCRKVNETFVEKAAVAEEPKTVFYPGMAVRFKHIRPDGKNRGVFVTTQKTPAGWFLSRLGGGDKDVRWHKVPESSIVPVDAINNADWSGAEWE